MKNKPIVNRDKGWKSFNDELPENYFEKLWKASLEKVLEAVESENVTNSVKNLKGKKEDDKEVVADDGLRMLIMRMGDIYLQKLYLTNVS